MNNYTESKYVGKYREYKFEFEGRPAEVAFPENMTDGAAWAFKTEYSGAFPAIETRLLEKGLGRAFLKNTNRWGIPEDLHAKARFAKFLHEEFGFSEKCVPVGYSCGGLMAVKFAAYYPECVSVLYIDAPVINYYDCPLKLGRGEFEESFGKEMLNALGLTLSELGGYRDQPLDCLPRIIEAKIPCALVYGDADEVVHHLYNARFVERAYKDSGIDFYTETVPGRGHHPHEPINFDAAVDFIMKHI